MKSQIALSIDQMKELKALGIDISDASLAWVPIWKEDKKTIEKYCLEEYSFGKSHYGHCPAYTLEDLIRKMPTYIPSLYNEHEGYILRTGAANPNQYYCGYEAISNEFGPLMWKCGLPLMDCVFAIFKSTIHYSNTIAKFL